LAHATVLEVDHPSTQRWKKARTASLPLAARAVRFVPVDFARDDLARALEAHGHDVHAPTMWIWEGVAMYLDTRAIAATLDVIAARSAAGSMCAMSYLDATARAQHIVTALVALAGEPFQSRHSPAQMRALWEPRGFRVREDAGTRDWAARFEQRRPRGTSIEHVVVVEKR
jgi:methyltransferase (TIGR00027 family)